MGLQVRILGCGSSGGVPRIGNDWGACDPSEPRNRRTRCSILLRSQGAEGQEPTAVLIDTSPDMREQLLAARVRRLDAVILSHEHADQCHGIDDLRAIVLINRRRMTVYMDERTAGLILPRFNYCFEGTSAYPAILEHRNLPAPGHALVVDGPGGPMTLIPLEQDHGAAPSLGFRVGNFAYCNDVVRLPDHTLARLHGLDVLIVDALRYAAHPTHAHVAQALEWIDRLKPRRAVLTNLHVDLDYRKLLSELPAGVEPAYDGMEIEI
jgi:phosphoribosyl 1,2-cyclic phosphate phosphodiesterase